MTTALELAAMASSLHTPLPFAQASPSCFHFPSKFASLTCRLASDTVLVSHSLALKTKVQVATAVSDTAPARTSLARRFLHLEDLALELSSSEADVPSILAPWSAKLSLDEWNALLLEVGSKDWNLAWQMFSMLKNQSALANEPALNEANDEKKLDDGPGDVVIGADVSLDVHKRIIKSVDPMKVYGNVVRVLAKHGRQEEVDAVKEKMEEAGIKPDSYFHSTLLDSYLLMGAVDKAYEVLLQMDEAGQKANPTIHQKVIFAYLEEENLDLGKATQIMEQFVKEGASVSASVFRNLITAYWLANDTEGAEKVFDTMRLQGHAPDLKVLIKLMQLHGRAGNHERVLELLELVTKLGIKPNSGVFDCLLQAYCKAGLVEKAKETFSKYRSVLGVRPSIIAYNMMIDSLGKHGLHEEALQLFAEMRKARLMPTTVSYNCIISAMVKVGQLEQVDRLYRRMLKDNVQPNLHTYMTLIQCYTKHNQTKYGHKIYNALKKSQIEMKDAAFQIVLVLYVEGNWYNYAAAILKEMENKGVVLDAVSHGSLIRSFGILESFLTPLAKAVQESSYGVCKLLTALFLSTQRPQTESEILNTLGPYFEEWNAVDDLDAKAHVYNAFMDCFWKKGLKGTARKILDLARDVYADHTRPQFNEDEWILDVRGLSVGGAKVALFDWLNGMSATASEDVINSRKVVIITGNEFMPNLVRDNRFLKGALMSMLGDLSSPFIESEKDTQKLEATASDVLKWTSESMFREVCSLTDAVESDHSFSNSS